ncbi:neuronal acetylcholine receptor subunit alpha-10-like [Convolutriloba macropyga]|uniref:neuronal acetylcholine receptor subunit alpha-10-like n=1 Tax=Convolutriloba macropyga TaxID=536237 RepID=UPI003F51B9DD
MTPLLLLVITVGCYIFYPPCEGALSSEPTDIKNDTTKSRIMGSKNVNKNVSQKIVNKKRHLSNMHRLIDDLLSNYDTSVVPTKSEKEKVEIRHLMVLNSIVQLDSKRQQLKVSVYETWEWHDFYLSWDPSLYNNITHTSIMRAQIWLPDLVILNEIHNGFTQQSNIRSNIIPANVHYTGKVKLETPSVVDTICEINISEFPFDTQVCELVFGSWSQGLNKLQLRNETPKIDLTHYVEDAEWRLMDTHIQSVNSSYNVKSINFSFSRLHYKMTLRRRMAFYSWNIVVPAILVNTMSILVFLLPPENGEKVSLGITILLALSVNMMVIRDYVPANSLQTPVLSTYTLVCMIATTLTLILSLPVVHVKSMGNKLGAPPNEKLLSICVLISKWLCLNKSTNDKFKNISLSLNHQKLFLEQLRNTDVSGKFLHGGTFSNGQHVKRIQRGSEQFTLFCNNNWLIGDSGENFKARYKQCFKSRLPEKPITECNSKSSPVSPHSNGFAHPNFSPQLQNSGYVNKLQLSDDEDTLHKDSTFADVCSNLALNFEVVLKSVMIQKQQVKISKLNAHVVYLKWICVVMIFDRCLAVLYAAINICYMGYFAPFYLSRSERWF